MMRITLPKPVTLSCPECKKPFEPLGFGHLESCQVGQKYRLPQLVTTGHHALPFGSRMVPLSRHREAHDMLDRLHWEHPDLVVIHGGAKGGDKIAEEWAKHEGVAIETWPVQWGLFPPWLAPLWRNAEMAARRPQEGIALIGPCEKALHKNQPPHPSHGSMDMAMRLQALDIPILVHTWGIPVGWGEALRTKVE